METGVERFVEELGGAYESDSAYCSHQSDASITTTNHHQTSKGGSLGSWMVNYGYFCRFSKKKFWVADIL